MRHLLYALPIGLATNQVGLTISISIVGQPDLTTPEFEVNGRRSLRLLSRILDDATAQEVVPSFSAWAGSWENMA